MLFILFILPIAFAIENPIENPNSSLFTGKINGMELSSPLPRCRNNDTYFLHDPRSCPGYFLCHRGVASRAECPFGFHFNEKEQICDKPSKVRCADPECPRQIGFIPWRNSCTQYHLCVQGIVVNDLKCPNGAHFDEARGQCNFPEVVQCGRDVCPQRTDAFDFSLQAHPEDCSKFFICNNNRKREFKCAEGFHWNSHFAQCVFVEDAGCEVATPKFRCPTVPADKKISLTFHPHPIHRDQYYICVGNTPHLRTCGQDLVFNREDGRCSRP